MTCSRQYAHCLLIFALAIVGETGTLVRLYVWENLFRRAGDTAPVVPGGEGGGADGETELCSCKPTFWLSFSNLFKYCNACNSTGVFSIFILKGNR